MWVKCKTFSSDAHVPRKATPGSACFHVYCARNISLGPGVTKSVELDLEMKFAKKYVCRIYPSSGLSLKLLFLGGGGVVDSNYRGNISVMLTNFSSWKLDIERGDRIAQMIIFKKEKVDFIEVEDFNDKTYRETKGFGSTGLKVTSSPVSC